MKKYILIVAVILTSTILFAQTNNPIFNQTNITSSIGIGTIIAIVASWTRNKSVLWAIFHAICGWLYVIYYVITR